MLRSLLQRAAIARAASAPGLQRARRLAIRAVTSSPESGDGHFSDGSGHLSDGSGEEFYDTKESYAVRRTTEWLQQKQLPNTSFRLSKMFDPVVNTGIYVDLPHGLTIAVETHPVACFSDFAETAVVPTSDTELLQTEAGPADGDASPRLVALTPLGYSSEEFTLRHREPEDLFRHITKFRDVLEDAETQDNVVHLAGGETIDLNRDKREHVLVDTVEAPNSGVLQNLAKQALY